MDKYLQLFIKDFCHLQYGLDIKLCTNKFIHNKFINEWQDISSYQSAYFKSADISAGFINDLHFFIIIFQKRNIDIMQIQAFFNNWHYYKQYPILLSAYV